MPSRVPAQRRCTGDQWRKGWKPSDCCSFVTEFSSTVESWHEARPLEMAAEEAASSRVRSHAFRWPEHLQNGGHSALWEGSLCALNGLQKMPLELTPHWSGHWEATGDLRHRRRGVGRVQTSPKPTWDAEVFRVRWLRLGPCPNWSGSARPEVHEKEAAPLQQAHRREPGEQNSSCSSGMEMIF